MQFLLWNLSPKYSPDTHIAEQEAPTWGMQNKRTWLLKEFISIKSLRPTHKKFTELHTCKLGYVNSCCLGSPPGFFWKKWTCNLKAHFKNELKQEKNVPLMFVICEGFIDLITTDHGDWIKSRMYKSDPGPS